MLRVLSSHRTLLAALTALPALVLAACGSSPQTDSGGMAGMPGMSHGSPSMSPGMQMGDPKAGLASSEQGYTFDSSTASLSAGGDQEYRFRILGPGGKPQASFVEDQTKLMHFYAIRGDLTGFQHLHPEMAADGTWSVRLPLSAPGPYRVYSSFIARDSSAKQHQLVLSRQLTVSGSYQPSAPPQASDTTSVDGYTVSLQGKLMSGMAMPFTIHITRGGQPVTNLQPYLDTYAHLTAFRSGNLAFAHLHPEQAATAGKSGGPDLSFHSELPASGDYRLFIQFQTDGQLHTAALTVHAT